MDKPLTIQVFSEKTGIPKSTLRYYESKGLLRPNERGENGYRLYRESQIEVAKLIASLRIADIPIRDIRAYVNEEALSRKKTIQSWIDRLEQKQERLHVSLQYLKSKSQDKHIYLLEKGREKVIWFAAESEPGNFENHFIHHRNELKKYGIPVQNGYFRYISGRRTVKGQIGFGIQDHVKTNTIQDVDVTEYMPACVCIAMPYTDSFFNIESGYMEILRYARDHHWIPTGSLFEWYRGDQLIEMDLMMPVMKFEKGEPES